MCQTAEFFRKQGKNRSYVELEERKFLPFNPTKVKYSVFYLYFRHTNYMMKGWILLALVFSLQGHSSAVHKGNETYLTRNQTTHVKPSLKHLQSSLPPVNDSLTSLQAGVPDSPVAITQNSSVTFSKPMSGSATSMSGHPSTANTSTITAETKFIASLKQDVPLSRKPARVGVMTGPHSSTTPVSSLSKTADFSTSSERAHTQANIQSQTNETLCKNEDAEINYNTSKITQSTSRCTHKIQIHTTSLEEQTSTAEPSTDAETSTLEMTDSSTDLETSTPEETHNLDSQTPATEIEESWTDFTDGSITEDYREIDTTEITQKYTDLTTTEFSTEKQIGDSILGESSVPNGVFPNSNHPLHHSTSPLARLVLKLSKPGVFGKGKSVFEDDVATETTSCPPGDVGLTCRRAEARKGADECSGGNCEVCRSCNDMAAKDWPHCCRDNFRCCSELAQACQQCSEPSLQVFCTKHFKRCF